MYLYYSHQASAVTPTLTPQMWSRPIPKRQRCNADADTRYEQGFRDACVQVVLIILLYEAIISIIFLFIPDTLCRSPCVCSGLILHCAGANLTAEWISQSTNQNTLQSRDLRSLIIPYNKISLIPTLFIKMHWLGKLNISHNLIRDVPAGSFADLSNLHELDLSFNLISSLETGSFKGLRSLLKLDISNNYLTTISKEQLAHLSSIKHLIISENNFGEVEFDAFDSIQSLKILNSDEFRFCCIAQQAEQCTPEADEFSSCEDLMANYTLQVILQDEPQILVIYLKNSQTNKKLIREIYLFFYFNRLLFGCWACAPFVEIPLL